MGTLNDQRKQQINSLRKTYKFLDEPEDISEEVLEILNRCEVRDNWGTYCFTEGECMNPGHERCAYRLLKKKEG